MKAWCDICAMSIFGSQEGKENPFFFHWHIDAALTDVIGASFALFSLLFIAYKPCVQVQ